MSLSYTSAPAPTYRLIPSRFPPIGLFDTVSTAADLAATLELVGWTNDRLVAERVARLPQTEWVYGRPNSSIIMASFLHVAPGGMRFNSEDLGAWYAAVTVNTAIAEVGHHLRREAVATSAAQMVRNFRTYTATLAGSYGELRGLQATYPALYDAKSYAAAQAFGEDLRAQGKDGLLFDSLRHKGGANVVTYRPSNIGGVVQTEHLQITVHAAKRQIDVQRLTTSAPSG